MYTNDKIKAFNIIVLEEDGTNLGQMPRDRALALAESRGVDLVQMAYNPIDKVCTAKLVDLGKYLYNKKKTDKDKRKNLPKEMKILKMSFSIGENDMKLKVQKAQEFLEDGHQVKILIQLKGRERSYISKAFEKIKTIQDSLLKFGKSQFQHPKEERGGYGVILIPNK